MCTFKNLEKIKQKPVDILYYVLKFKLELLFYKYTKQINNHVTCMAISGEDEVIVGLVTGQLQAYSLSKWFVLLICFSKSVLCLSFEI